MKFFTTIAAFLLVVLVAFSYGNEIDSLKLRQRRMAGSWSPFSGLRTPMEQRNRAEEEKVNALKNFSFQWYKNRVGRK